MNPEQFVYWLQGFAELAEQAPSAEQWQSIREHLALVLGKRTPPAPGDIKAIAMKRHPRDKRPY